MTKPDIDPDDLYPEPDALEPAIIPLPEPVPVIPTPGADLGLPAGAATPGPPAAGPPSIAPPGWNPQPPVRGPEGGARGRRGEIVQMGRFDAFVGVVRDTYEGDTHPTLGTSQGINAERVDVRWDAATNKPLNSVTPSPAAGGSNVVACNPWPGRHDQTGYQTKVGDVITILRGADGLNWYLADDLPFIGVVVAWDDDAVTEEYFGGARNSTVDGHIGLKVRQQAISGDPTATQPTLADLETIAEAWLTATAYIVDDIVLHSTKTYRCISAHTSLTTTREPPNATYWQEDNIVIHRYVNVLRTAEMNFGYRVGDKILVVRRGLYLFCLPLAQTFMGILSVGANSGPSSAADFADEHYWVKEAEGQVTYGTDNWTFDAVVARSQTDPTGSGGRMGRWVDAVNLAERPDATHLLDNGVLVEVTMWTDANDLPYYTFTHAPPAEDTISHKVKVHAGDTADYLNAQLESGTHITFVGGNIDKLSFDHEAPGASSACTGSDVWAMDVDALGHVRTFRACGGATKGPCA